MAQPSNQTAPGSSSMSQRFTSMSRSASIDLQRECDRLVEHNTTCAHPAMLLKTQHDGHLVLAAHSML